MYLTACAILSPWFEENTALNVALIIIIKKITLIIVKQEIITRIFMLANNGSSINIEHANITMASINVMKIKVPNMCKINLP